VYAPFRNTQVVSTLKYNYGRYSDGSPLPLIAPLKNVTSARYDPGRFAVQAEFEASARQQRVDPKAGEPETDGFRLWHFRATYRLNWMRMKTTLKIEAGVENLFDTAYSEHLDFGRILRPGRNIYTGVSLGF